MGVIAAFYNGYKHDADGVIKWWNTGTAKLVRVRTHPWVNALVMSPDGHTLATGSSHPLRDNRDRSTVILGAGTHAAGDSCTAILKATVSAPSLIPRMGAGA